MPLNPRPSNYDTPDLDPDAFPDRFWPRACPARNTFAVETACSEIYRLSGIDLTLDTVLQQVVADLEAETQWAIEAGSPVPPEDLVVWSRGRVVAVVRRRKGQGPDVVRLDV